MEDKMNEINFSTKAERKLEKELKKFVEKPKIEKIEDRTWFKTECTKCPYFINDEILQMLHCVRPNDENCLAEGTLVAGVIAAEKYNETIKKSYVNKPKIKWKCVKLIKNKRR